jgi:DNA polymerase-2
MPPTSPPESLLAFLLTSQWRDTASGLELEFWASSERGPIRILARDQSAICFLARAADLPPGADAPGIERRPVDLRTLSGEPVDALYCSSQRRLQTLRAESARAGAALYESDLKPNERYLMERFVRGGLELHGSVQQRAGYLEMIDPALRAADYEPGLRSVAIDIETSDLDGELYSIAAISSRRERVFMIGETPSETDDVIEYHPDERGLLRGFFGWLRDLDPDLILGWNVVGFDLDFLERRCRRLGIPFALGRGGEQATILQPGAEGQLRIARVPGRVVLDGIDSLRTATWAFERYDLEYVADRLLGRGKLIREGDKLEQIRRLFAADKPALAAYNLEDCRLVLEIFETAKLIPFLIQRTRMTGLTLDRQGGSVAAFDNLYLPRLHRRGYVAPDVGSNPDRAASPGGFVMDSRPGLYDNVLVLDFKSLYPSIIRSFQIDPLALAVPGDDPVPGFLDGTFARHGAILPELITELWGIREAAKRAEDPALSQAVKILMNSFYGVLGSFGCRFFDPRLASSITRRGHEIINRSRERIEGKGIGVVYGDTDSLFVLLGPGHTEAAARDIGAELAGDLNRWWHERLAAEHRLESHLEIEFETHYLRFLMPTVRGAETGSKKRYAGLVRGDGGDHLVFKGLESVRSDWTPLAREVQRELYRRVFLDEPYEDYLREIVARLSAGELDELLVYRKRLRRPLEAYVRNVPPHVQAARKLERHGRDIEYVITLNGPEPVEARHSALDYDHYIDRQLAPVADGILHFLGRRFDEIARAQLAIF